MLRRSILRGRLALSGPALRPTALISAPQLTLERQPSALSSPSGSSPQSRFHSHNSRFALAPVRGFSKQAKISTTKGKKKNDDDDVIIGPGEAFLKADEKRVGAIGMKMGMMSLFDDYGVKRAVTVIQIPSCQVVAHEPRPNRKGFNLVRLGAGYQKPKRVSKRHALMYERAGVLPKRRCWGFPVTKSNILPLGTTIHARHFLPGQLIDIMGVSKGKGFAGPMKRWGFGGQQATHGVSRAHRSHGSTGAGSTPGKTHKGKKMAGQMGGDKKLIYNMRIFKIDPKRDLLYVLGSIPGRQGGWVMLRDAMWARWQKPEQVPPFPTYTPIPDEQEPDELVMPLRGEDPLVLGY